MSPDVRGDILAKLFRLFPGGLQDGQRFDYLGAVHRAGIDAATLSEAVERLESTHTTNTCPKIAVVLRTCREVQGERSRTQDDRRWSHGEVHDLALRRLKLQNLAPTTANIEREFYWIRRLGVVQMDDA